MSKLRLAAAALLLLWAGFWAFFAFAQAPPLPIATGAALVLFAVPLIAWRWRGPGGTVLAAEGLALLAWVTQYLRNPPPTTFLLILTLALPPLLAGILLIADAWKPSPSDLTQGCS